MVDLDKAREIAKLIRISEDKPSKSVDAHDLKGREDHKDTMLRHGVLISKSVTPSLDSQLNSVCETLHTPRECVSAFVLNILINNVISLSPDCGGCNNSGMITPS